MTEIRFYHLQQKKLEQALPEILAKALERGHRVAVKADSAERLEALNGILWTYDPESFLPHGMARDGHEAEQPVWLTTEDDNPNQASVLVLVDGAPSAAVEKFELCCEIFDGNDAAAVGAARQRWKTYKDKGFSLTYFQQDDAGKWQKK
ncbi:MAG: DNA polymerase III subunit chi [Alphaproteobacteria bacterium]|nr:DNA polymerase III subunit chi [Alphaproteobacteria bacterium]